MSVDFYIVQGTPIMCPLDAVVSWSLAVGHTGVSLEPNFATMYSYVLIVNSNYMLTLLFQQCLPMFSI